MPGKLDDGCNVELSIDGKYVGRACWMPGQEGLQRPTIDFYRRIDELAEEHGMGPYREKPAGETPTP